MKHTHSPATKLPHHSTMADEEDEDNLPQTFNSTTDICAQLTQRYSTSTAPQHRHLLATAAAIKSLLLEASLPLSPLSYFTSAIKFLSLPQNDVASASAIATFLSLVMPLVPKSEVSNENAADGAAILVRVLEREMVVASTSSAKCVVKCLGVLLGFCDLEDWEVVDSPLRTLLHWSIDKRPKVRKCALVHLENALKCIQCSAVKKKASNLVLSQLENYVSVAVKLGVKKNNDGSKSERQCEAEQLDIVHALNVVRVALPFLCDKSSAKIILKMIELLDIHSSTLTRPVLNAIEVFLEKVEDGIVTQVVEDIINALSSYVSSKRKSKDSVICAANLLKISLDKLHARDTVKWSRNFSIGFKAIAGLLTHEDDIALKSSNILKILVIEQLPDIESQPAHDVDKNDDESKVIASICSTFMEFLDSKGTPNEHTLSVLSVLFLKLGRSSDLYMGNIVLKLAEIFTRADGNKHDTSHLQKCFGSAIIAMGADNILSLVPISFDVENITYANMWMLPILKMYTCGASIGYFMEHIVPIAKSLKKASRKVKKSVIGQDLQALSRGLWGLLPAFCRYPTDINKNFQSFAKLMLVRLKKDASMHEDIADALQELVKQNKCLQKFDASIIEPIRHSLDFSLEDYILEKRNSHCYSKKAATRNIKSLSSHVSELLLTLMTTFLDSKPKKRPFLKNAISCLASISDSTVTKKIFLSSLEKFSSAKAAVSGDSDPSNSVSDMPLDTSSTGDDPQWSLILDLASSIVEGADEELVDLIFRSTKHALQAGDGKGVSEAYYTLSCILEEHPWFCSVKMDELVDLIIGLKSPTDIASFSNRLSCLQLLLVHALKSSQDSENTKPFLILNDLILSLKDSREDARKIAYDILLKISSCVADSSAAYLDGPYNRLISMIQGYLSGPSPHITSAAISALSVLVFKEPELCLKVPHVVSSVTSLLQTKAVETIKAVLGFIKVLVSCLEGKDLEDFVPAIVDGVLPWSSISRHHFRSKVTVILEILIRKCGFPTIKLLTPERYQSFIRKVSQSRHGKTASKEADSLDVEQHLSSDPTNGPKKRSRNETNDRGSDSKFQNNKRRKQMQDSKSPTAGGTRSNVGGFDRKPNRFQHSKPKFGQNQRSQKFDRAPSTTTSSTLGGSDKTVKRFQHYKPKSGQNQRSQKFDRTSGSNKMRHGPKNGQKGGSRQ